MVKVDITWTLSGYSIVVEDDRVWVDRLGLVFLSSLRRAEVIYEEARTVLSLVVVDLAPVRVSTLNWVTVSEGADGACKTS